MKHRKTSGNQAIQMAPDINVCNSESMNPHLTKKKYRIEVSMTKPGQHQIDCML